MNYFHEASLMNAFMLATGMACAVFLGGVVIVLAAAFAGRKSEIRLMRIALSPEARNQLVLVVLVCPGGKLHF